MPPARRGASGGPVAPGPVPGAGALREAALAHLARFSTTESGLTRVLERRLQRWAQRATHAGGDADAVLAQQQGARSAIAGIVADLRGIGAVDDNAFAQSRARALARGGRSRRAIGAHLAQHGVAAKQAGEAVRLATADVCTPEEAELAAALVQARRRRIGPFRRPAGPSEAADLEASDEDPAPERAGLARRPPSDRQRALASLARAGFAHDVASRALDTELDAAEEMIARLRSG